MYCVYLLKSLSDSSKSYVGFTTQAPMQRLEEHNSGKSSHTKKYLPWKLIVQIAFENEKKAREFETYLKHGSGHAFAKKHFW